MNKFYYTWEMLDKDIKKFLVKLSSEPSTKFFLNVYGIERGGLVIAVCLSHALNIPLIIRRDYVTKDTLVVDDVSDSGKTLTEFMKKRRFKPRTLTVFVKPKTSYKPDYSFRRDASWIIFPWEKYEKEPASKN